MARCNRCGHESDLDVYTCDNCDYIIKSEPIESIPVIGPFFKRPATKWFEPDKHFKRIIKVINPLTSALAFRDINKKKDKKGPRWIIFLNGLLIGLWTVAVGAHVNFAAYGTLPATGITFNPFSLGTTYVAFLNSFAYFLAFFIFGLLYYNILFYLYNYAFSISSNFSNQLDGILAIRYNVQLKKSKTRDFMSGKSRLQKQGVETGFSVEKVAGKKPLTKISQTGKNWIMIYGYAPLIAINFLSFLLLLIFLPSIDIANTTNITSLISNMEVIWDSKLWLILDLLQVIGILWVAGTISLALREIGNTNTTRLFIGNLVVAALIAFTTILLRPTTGAGNWNLIETWFGGG